MAGGLALQAAPTPWVPILVASSVAFVATSAELWMHHDCGPFRPRRALGWWISIGFLDAAIAGLSLFGARLTSTAGNAGGPIGWVTMGLLVPLGLRSPFWGRRDADQLPKGLVPFYEKARSRLSENLSLHLIQRKHQQRLRARAEIVANGWSVDELTKYVQDVLVEGLDAKRERKKILQTELKDQLKKFKDADEKLDAILLFLWTNNLRKGVDFCTASRPDGTPRAEPIHAGRRKRKRKTVARQPPVDAATDN